MGTALSSIAFGICTYRFIDNLQPLLTKAFLVLLKRILGYSNKIGHDRIVTHNVLVRHTQFAISSDLLTFYVLYNESSKTYQHSTFH
jgi:hypothetical protein